MSNSVITVIGKDRIGIVYDVSKIRGPGPLAWARAPEGPGRVGADGPELYDLVARRPLAVEPDRLSREWETAWRSLHRPGAPELYPVDLRGQIDAVNQCLTEEIGQGPYKALLARSPQAARKALEAWDARLAGLDRRLADRRYLFGDRITDCDVHLFTALLSLDQIDRPGFPSELGRPARLTDHPHLWAYARDLLATPGFVSEAELVATGILTGPDGSYAVGHQGERISAEELGANPLARWTEPAGRDHLATSPPPTIRTASRAEPGGPASPEPRRAVIGPVRRRSIAVVSNPHH